MRRLVSGLGALLLAGGLAVAGGSPAHAACPGATGTVPGSGPTVTPVGLGDGTQYGTIYIDDRDYVNQGEIWGYIETNTVADLQRGGDQLIFTFGVNPGVPAVPPTQVLPPNPGGAPVLPNGLTLFPKGLGGGSLAEAVGEHDSCTTDRTGAVWTGTPDNILF
jgi:hypothetical protein